MANLQETSNPERRAEIDTVGWLFLAFAVVIMTTAAMIAYEGKRRDGRAPVSHLAAR